MDDVSSSNQGKWDELARRGVLYSRPLLDLNVESAREWLDPYDMLGDVRGKQVLCLGGGGGKQSAAFGCLGAQVHVLDVSSEMLARDRMVAGHYGFMLELLQGDMRDLSVYENEAFHIVFQPYSINYVPDPLPVFEGAARILKAGGMYVLELGNPFSLGLNERDWDGQGYPLRLEYRGGGEIPDPLWTFTGSDGAETTIPGPRTFRHTLSGVINPLARLGMHLERIEEVATGDIQARPGSWDHMVAVAPPWMTLWFIKW